MNKKEVFDLIEHELDTDYELSLFLNKVFNYLGKEVLLKLVETSGEYDFMISEWMVVDKCQRELLNCCLKIY